MIIFLEGKNHKYHVQIWGNQLKSDVHNSTYVQIIAQKVIRDSTKCKSDYLEYLIRRKKLFRQPFHYKLTTCWYFILIFSSDKQLKKWPYHSVCSSVWPSIHPSIRLFVSFFWHLICLVVSGYLLQELKFVTWCQVCEAWNRTL